MKLEHFSLFKYCPFFQVPHSSVTSSASLPPTGIFLSGLGLLFQSKVLTHISGYVSVSLMELSESGYWVLLLCVPLRAGTVGGSMFFFKQYLCILFLVMLGLRCYADLSLVAVGRGCSLVTAQGLLIAGASLVAELRPQDVQAPIVATRVPSSCGTRAELPGGMRNLSTCGDPCVPCIGRWILNHWTTREVPRCSYDVGEWMGRWKEQYSFGKVFRESYVNVDSSEQTSITSPSLWHQCILNPCASFTTTRELCCLFLSWTP